MSSSPRNTGPRWHKFAIVIPYAWLLLFFLAPFIIVLKISLADPIIAQPPYTPLLDWSKEIGERLFITLDNYRYLVQDKLYIITYLNSLKLAGISTLLCLLLGYPMAYGIARSDEKLRRTLLILVILPFWISFLLRVYAWMGLLNTHGVINSILLWLGVIDAPLQLLYTDAAIFLGMVYSYLPFMILPLYSSLEKLDNSLLEAAADLGAHPSTVFRDITVPATMPGIIAGCLLVFIPAVGEFVIPALLGGPDTLMIGRVLFDEFFLNRDWPVAAAVAVVLLVVLIGPIMYLQHLQAAQRETQ